MIVYEKKDLAGPLISPTKACTLHKTWVVYEREKYRILEKKAKLLKRIIIGITETKLRTGDTLPYKNSFFHCCCGMNKVCN